MRNHYETLGIERDEPPEKIRSAYLKLSKKYHPDKNLGNEAEASEKFKQINAAYTVLSDEHLKQQYDTQFQAASKIPDPPPHNFFFNKERSQALPTWSAILEKIIRSYPDFQVIDFLHIVSKYRLSLEEVSSFTHQEAINLTSAFKVIEARLMTIAEAKKLTEAERLILTTHSFAGPKGAFETLQSFRKMKKDALAQSRYGIFSIFNNEATIILNVQKEMNDITLIHKNIFF